MDAGKKERIDQIISGQLMLDAEELKPADNIQDDLGADSLDLIEFVMEFEDAFDIEIADEDVETLKTVQDVYDYVEKRTARI